MVSKSTGQCLKIYVRKIFLSTPGKLSLNHQEVASDIVSEPPTKKSCFLTAAIINVADNSKFSSKITMTQEEGYLASSTTYVEEICQKHQNNIQTYLLKTCHRRGNLP